jgi:general secretion pathway protein N
MTRWWVWGAAALLAVLLTVMATLPASWLVPLVEQQTGGRVSLGDPQGSVWQGSAFIGAASSAGEPLAPLLPGRFAWRLSPLVLAGRLDAELSNERALERPLTLRGSWRNWEVSTGAITLPAERLAALGAPLNTVKPSGRLRLSWPALSLERTSDAVRLYGSMQLDMTEIASALSPVKPLGAYRMVLLWRGDAAHLTLGTRAGPLMLEGAGDIVRGRLQFSGQAWAQEGKEQNLAILLNLLGQRRQLGSRSVTALEFK